MSNKAADGSAIVYESGKKTKGEKTGILLIVLPFVTLPVVLMLYAIVSFVANSMQSGSVDGMSEGSLNMVVVQIASMILGFIGVLAVLGIIIGVPVGIYLLVRKK